LLKVIIAAEATESLSVFSSVSIPPNLKAGTQVIQNFAPIEMEFFSKHAFYLIGIEAMLLD